jgi:hypothetical protein
LLWKQGCGKQLKESEGVYEIPGTFILRCFGEQFLFDDVKVVRKKTVFKPTYRPFPDAKRRPYALKPLTARHFNKIY